MSSVEVTFGPPRSSHASRPAVVCVGVFDGVHRGHRWLIGQAKEQAAGSDLPLTVMTFDPHPKRVVRPDSAPCQLSSLEQRVELLSEAGADQIRVVNFDDATAAMSPEQFVSDYLVQDLSAEHVVVGENWRFGNRAAGDVKLLAQIGESAGFGVTGVGLHTSRDGEVWSSSRIRDLVALGQVENAAEGLLRWHRCEGEIVVGDQRGRELGYPTANLQVPAESCRPADGVYAGFLVRRPYEAQPEVFPAAVSVGVNSTFDGTESRVEAYALDRTDLDIYGEYAAVDFVARLRGMENFGGVEELLSAMAADVSNSRRILAPQSPL